MRVNVKNWERTPPTRWRTSWRRGRCRSRSTGSRGSRGPRLNQLCPIITVRTDKTEKHAYNGTTHTIWRRFHNNEKIIPAQQRRIERTEIMIFLHPPRIYVMRFDYFDSRFERWDTWYSSTRSAKERNPPCSYRNHICGNFKMVVLTGNGFGVSSLKWPRSKFN